MHSADICYRPGAAIGNGETKTGRKREASMLLTGKEYLESIRDGRKVYVGRELVEDVTAHPAFRNAAKSFAMIYDRKRAPENRDVMTAEEDGETFSSYFLLPRTREDLHKRFETHRRIASWTHGLLGR
jgi:4-hydroxyphenylacetate 3-monooxygenase